MAYTLELKVQITPKFLFAKTNLLAIWNTSAKKKKNWIPLNPAVSVVQRNL